MDLYRTLRVSLYLLAASGAFAISIAEQNLYYLVLISSLAGLSFLVVDRGKIKPLSAELTAVLTLVLLYLALHPLRDDPNWQTHFPAAVGHFLCAWQGLLFFSVYGGPVLLTFCGSTLAIVVISGVVQSGPSLALRVGCFIAIAVWTLYIHALWRARQEFAGLSTILNTLDGKTQAQRIETERLRRLPEGSFWGTVILVAGMSCACIALGVIIFFSAPRIEGLLAFFERREQTVEKKPDDFRPIAVGHDASSAMLTGEADSLNLRNIGQINPDSRQAMRATFSRPASAIAGSKNRILFKAHNLSDYYDGRWIPEKPTRNFDSKNGLPIQITDPSLDGNIRPLREDWTQTIEAAGLHTRNIFASGPVLRVAPGIRKIEMDSEGSLRSADSGALTNYSLSVAAPLDPSTLPARAIADHRSAQRYIRQSGLLSPDAEAITLLARRITRGLQSDPERAAAIQRWLETNRSYTLNLDQLHARGDPTAHFLRATDPNEARGHCGLFASAFVLLCRLNNMPARICTGFAARVDPSDATSTSVVVLNSDAHAWAEVYYKGFGWATYDPTPAAPSSESSSDPAIAKNSPPVSKPPASTPAAANGSGDESTGMVQSAWKTLMGYNGREQRKWYETLSGTPGSGARGILTGSGYGGWIGAVIAWAGIAAAIGWLVHLFAKRHAPRKYVAPTGANRARAAVAFYNDLLTALSRRGYSRQPGQTPREFAAAVMKRGGESFAPVRDITEIFEAVRYGGGDLAQDEFNRLHEALDKVKEMTF